MSVRVNANELLPEVLKCLCEMRDMDPEEYMFDLPPVTSIASKTLLQLDTNRVKIVPRAAGRVVCVCVCVCVCVSVCVVSCESV